MQPSSARGLAAPYERVFSTTSKGAHQSAASKLSANDLKGAVLVTGLVALGRSLASITPGLNRVNNGLLAKEVDKRLRSFHNFGLKLGAIMPLANQWLSAQLVIGSGEAGLLCDEKRRR